MSRLTTIRWLTTLFLVVAVLLLVAVVKSTPAQTLGMVADTATNKVIVFDTDTDTVLGSVPLGGGLIGDCSVTSDQTLGFVTDLVSRIWVIDLAASPPVLAAAPNPIMISNPGEDTALTHDDRFLVVCDGFGTHPVSVIDVATRTEVETFSLGTDCTGRRVRRRLRARDLVCQE